MASVMSLAMIVFIAVPVIAPSLGQAVLLLTQWRGIFVVLICTDSVAAAAINAPADSSDVQTNDAKANSFARSSLGFHDGPSKRVSSATKATADSPPCLAAWQAFVGNDRHIITARANVI